MGQKKQGTNFDWYPALLLPVKSLRSDIWMLTCTIDDFCVVKTFLAILKKAVNF